MSANAARFPLSRKGRRALLVVHVVFSVSWLGLTLGILTLGLAGRFSGDPDTARAAYLSLKVFGDWLLIPVSQVSLVSGVWLGLGTRWGLLRHRWVVVKLVLTVAASTASIFALRATINAAAGSAAAGAVEAGAANDLITAPCVATCVYPFSTAISVLKPWGPTGRGRRFRAEVAATAATARPSR